MRSGRSTCRRSTASWWRNTMISRFFERPDRTVSRASDARNRYKIRYTRTQHRPPSSRVNDHGRVSGTHRDRRANQTSHKSVISGGREVSHDRCRPIRIQDRFW